MSIIQQNYGELGANIEAAFDSGITITAKKAIDCGFKPEQIFVVYHLPNYINPVYTVYWDRSMDPTHQYMAGFGNSNSAIKYDYPYSSGAAMIYDITDTGFSIGYNSVLGPHIVDYVVVGTKS